MRLNSLSEMKATSIIALVGGVASALAFVLPWYLFFSGMSLLAIADGSETLSFQAALKGAPALAWIELVAAVIVIVGPMLVSVIGKRAEILTLVGSAIGLLFVLYLFIDIISAFGALSAPPPGTDPNFIAILNEYVRPITSMAGPVFLGVGFWMATVGFTTALIASLRALAARPKRVWVTSQPTEPEAIGAGSAQ
jgi:hypothetical protein